MRSVGEITESDLSQLFPDDTIKDLRSAIIIRDGETRKTVLCNSCDEEHYIEWNKLPDGRFLALCDHEENALPQYIASEKLVTSQIGTVIFLTALSASLDAETDIKSLVSDELWEIGIATIAKRKRKLMFLQSNNSQRHAELINVLSQTIPVIVFSIHAPPLNITDQVTFIDPTLFSTLTRKGLRIDKSALETSLLTSSQRVFLKQNGDLTLDGSILCNIPRHTVEYSFAERLMQNYAYPVSHDELYKYCTTAHGMDSARTQQKYCNDYRSNITKLASNVGNKAIVNKIILSAKTAWGDNAYKIQNPVEKFTAK